MKRIINSSAYIGASESIDDLREQVRMYIMDDTHRKENFADLEICTEDDNYVVNDIILDMMQDFTADDCQAFLAAVDDPEFDVISGGWKDSYGYHYISKPYEVFGSGELEHRIIFTDGEDIAMAESLLDDAGCDYDYDSNDRMMINDDGIEILSGAGIDFDVVV